MSYANPQFCVHKIDSPPLLRQRGENNSVCTLSRPSCVCINDWAILESLAHLFSRVRPELCQFTLSCSRFQEEMRATATSIKRLHLDTRCSAAAVLICTVQNHLYFPLISLFPQPLAAIEWTALNPQSPMALQNKSVMCEKTFFTWKDSVKHLSRAS